MFQSVYQKLNNQYVLRPSLQLTDEIGTARDGELEFPFDQSVRYSMGCGVAGVQSGWRPVGLSVQRECSIVLSLSFFFRDAHPHQEADTEVATFCPPPPLSPLRRWGSDAFLHV